MIDKICTFLTKKIQKEMPDIDEEKAEIINYGLQNIIGEIPKIFLLFFISWVLGILKEVLFMFIILLPYRGASGGFHLKTHLGCIIGTTLFYCGVAFLSKNVVIGETIKYLLVIFGWIFGMIMIKLYAPADTENVPILSKKERKKKQIMSYLTFTIGMMAGLLIKDNVISNILIIGNLVQTLNITKLAYKITKNKYGYEVYGLS
ncbi:MAG: accessory gene regulator B family protein [Clostridia bacterium]|nr:accessory gene regulator B family protein [Clostridium sp.]